MAKAERTNEFALDSCVDRSTAISTRVRLFRLFLLIPCWESQRLIPKRSAGPRATKIGVVSLKALDHHRPNRGESAILALNYPPPERTVGEARERHGSSFFGNCGRIDVMAHAADQTATFGHSGGMATV